MGWHHVGLDLISDDGAKAVWAEFSTVTDPDRTSIGPMRDAGDLSVKSGKVLYDWTTRDPVAFKQQRDAEIIRRVKVTRGAKIQS